MVGCSREAFRIPQISFCAEGFPYAGRAKLTIDLPLCPEHAAQECVDLIDKDLWERLDLEFAKLGRSKPDRASVILEFVRLD
jgi:hypothetical protein